MSEQKSTSVYKLKNGMWGYRFVLTIEGKQISQRRTKDENGKPFRTEKSASKCRERAMKKALQEATQSKKPTVRKKLSEIYKEYCESGRTEKAFATIKKQDALWYNHIVHKFGSCYIDDIRVSDVYDYLTELLYMKGYAYGYVEAFLKFFYLIFGQAYSRNYLTVDDYNKLCVNKNTKLKMPPKKSTDIKDIHSYSEEELHKMDAFFEGTTVETAYKIGRYTGLRVAECYGLTWERVNFEERYILVERQMHMQDGLVKLLPLKTANAKRKVYMCEALYDYLWNLKMQIKTYEKEFEKQRQQNEKFVLDYDEGKISSLSLVNTLPNGRIQTEHAIRHYAPRIREQLSIDFRYHDLRHTYGTRLAMMNTPQHILLNQMGHTKSSTTNRYYLAMSKEAVDELKSNINKL